MSDTATVEYHIIVHVDTHVNACVIHTH